MGMHLVTDTISEIEKKVKEIFTIPRNKLVDELEVMHQWSLGVYSPKAFKEQFAHALSSAIAI